MATPSYVNQVTPQEISLALEAFLIAPANTAWTIGRIDPASPPAGFYYLGAVADDSPSVSVSKQTYDLSTGIPAVLQYQAVVGMSGQMGAVLHTFDPYAAYLAGGGMPPYHVPKTTSSVFGTVAATTQLRTTMHVVSNAFAVAVGDLVVTGTTATDASALNTSRNYAWVTAATSTAAGWALTLQGNGFPNVPVSGSQCFAVSYTRQAQGSTVLPEFVVLGVADALNGTQIVHYAQKARPAGEWSATIRNGAHIQTPIAFNLLGYSVTSPYSSSGQLVVMEAFTFWGNTIQ